VNISQLKLISEEFDNNNNNNNNNVYSEPGRKFGTPYFEITNAHTYTIRVYLIARAITN
jgi:hypothetical protein